MKSEGWELLAQNGLEYIFKVKFNKKMGTKHKEFKTFDKVLVRGSKSAPWEIDFYSHFDNDANRHETVCRYCRNEENLLPYEGNEHLVGTTDEPEKQVQIKYWEWIMGLNGCLDEPSNDPSDWNLEQINYISGEENIETKRGHLYCYFIRFSDFNPNDMEETKKHILCVKNGRVVKYKG